MATEKATISRAESLFSLSALSLDTWAVVAALVLALAVRFDVLKNIVW